MDFKETQAIYLQIVDLVCDHIVTGKWKAQERIPSVREDGTGEHLYHSEKAGYGNQK